MNKLSYAFLVITLMCLQACRDKASLQKEASAIADRQFEEIDLERIDQYPQFSECDELQQGPDCFYQHLHQLIATRLREDRLSWQLEASDSLVARISVSANGQIRYDSIARCAERIDKKRMDSVLRKKLDHLPKIQSALKKDIPVSSSYLLPIILQPVGQD
ncbi:hypothetical protein [Nonlabens xiamenensis]|uniref:hypothetical protein n=1 Tax=Nonlabens xiamenensis TaxID=2341043 RepID=UPI000F611526|nr:hypothetical protein [Nonlabens xiamenensis]